MEDKRVPNLPENAAQLSFDDGYGNGYLVDYWDVKAQETRFGMGIWRDPEFEFPAFTARDAPVMDGWSDPTKNKVTGWTLIKEMRVVSGEKTEEFAVAV
jgi:hypothetical protein